MIISTIVRFSDGIEKQISIESLDANPIKVRASGGLGITPPTKTYKYKDVNKLLTDYVGETVAINLPTLGGFRDAVVKILAVDIVLELVSK